ncbi:MAG: polysaccharide lyase [Cocleimonas sp.]
MFTKVVTINSLNRSMSFYLVVLLSLVYLVFPALLLAEIKSAEADFCHKNKSDQTIFCLDFQNNDNGLYTSEHLIKDWPNLQSLSDKANILNLGVTQKRVEVADINNNHALKIKYPKERFGSWLTGATWIMKLPKANNKKPYEQLSLEYKVMFRKGFLFNREGLFGGKLPGLMGGETISGGATATGRNGWTSRLMWGQMGRGLGYLYYPDMKDDAYNQKACPRYGLDHELCVIKRNKYFTFDENGESKCLSEWAAGDYEFRFGTERFYKIKQQIRMNTLPDEITSVSQGNRDGELKIWLDDKLVVDCTNIRFRDVPELAIDSLIFSTFFGGNTPESSAHPHDEAIYFDDFLISF